MRQHQHPTSTSIVERLDKIEQSLLDFLLEVRGLRLELVESARKETKSVSEGRHRPIREGDRIRINTKDKYHLRTATVLDRRGKTYWNLRLDPVLKEGTDRVPREGIGQIIYKTDSSLDLIE